MISPELFSLLIQFAEALLVLGMLITFVRLVKGPSLPDRVVALDLCSTFVVGIIAVDAIVSDNATFLRIAIVIALLSFVGTVAFAHFIGKGGQP